MEQAVPGNETQRQNPPCDAWAGEQMGGGPLPFVWLHGWGHDRTSLHRLSRLFRNDGLHWLLDQPGFGATPRLSDGVDGHAAGSAEYAENLAAIWNRLYSDSTGQEGVVLIGHSFGARVAIQFAARYPDKVAALILISGAGIPPRRSAAFRIRAFFLRQLGRVARFTDSIASTALTDAYRQRFGSADYRMAEDMRGTLVRVIREDLSARAREVRAPTLLLYGSEDRDTPPEIGRRYEACLPIARFHELGGFGHLDILDRGAYQCEALIRGFLDDLELDHTGKHRL